MEDLLRHEGLQLIAYLGLAAGLKLVAAHKLVKPWRKGVKRRQVGRVSGLMVYPVKSARAINVQQAECTLAGLRMIRADGQLPVADRYWMVTTSDYEPITLMDYPRMALVSTDTTSDCLILTAPGLDPFTLPINMSDMSKVPVSIQNDTVQGQDCGDAVADWLNKVLGVTGCRMVCYPQDVQPQVRKKYESVLSPNHGVAFAWSTPIVVIAEESLTDLNSRLEVPCSMETLRPNISVEGSIAYDEEFWEKASIGPVNFEKAKLCDRCRTINVDIEKGTRYTAGTGPLDTLRKFRPLTKENGYRPILGMKYKVINPGIIKIGDPIFVEE